MALEKCVQCGHGISKQAKACPNCSTSTSAQERERAVQPCRSCGTGLSRSAHKLKQAGTRIVNGDTQHYSYITDVPCTNCGDPVPLGPLPMTGALKWGLTAAAVLIVLVTLFGH